MLYFPITIFFPLELDCIFANFSPLDLSYSVLWLTGPSVLWLPGGELGHLCWVCPVSLALGEMISQLLLFQRNWLRGLPEGAILWWEIITCRTHCLLTLRTHEDIVCTNVCVCTHMHVCAKCDDEVPQSLFQSSLLLAWSKNDFSRLWPKFVEEEGSGSRPRTDLFTIVKLDLAIL